MIYSYVIQYVCGTRVDSDQLRAALEAAPSTPDTQVALRALLTLGARGQAYSYQADDCLSHCVTVACRALGLSVDDLARTFPA